MSNDDILAAFNRAVSDNTAQVINVSLGECETGAQSSGFVAAADQVFQQALALGQTFSVSTGDSGSYECGDHTSRQSYPAVSLYVMAIGGTTTTTDADGNYLSESAWSNGGGGPSITETAPDWQLAANVLGRSKKRGVPDISFDANPASGALVIVRGTPMAIGGTSLSAPIFTGFWARILAANSNVTSFPATLLYPLAARAFNNITTGSNGGFKTRTGRDYTTGWGSVNISTLSSLPGSIQ